LEYLVAHHAVYWTTAVLYIFVSLRLIYVLSSVAVRPKQV